MQFGTDPDPDDRTLLPPGVDVPPATVVEPDDVDGADDDAIDEPDQGSEQPEERPVEEEPPQSTVSVFQPIAETMYERPVSVSVPGLEAEAIPNDLVEITHGQSHMPKAGSPAELKDAATRTREKKPEPAVVKKQETEEKRWRALLDGLSTTRLVHVKLLKEANGSFVSAGARYNVDVNVVRAPEKLIPYGNGSSVTPQRWIIAVAPNTARFDDESAYRQFVFERIGPMPPAGWSLDSALAFADQEVSEDDLPTLREIGTAVVEDLRSRGMLVVPGGAVAPAAPAAPAPQGPGGGMMGPYGMMPFYPPYFPPQMSGLARSDDDDRRRRDEEERRRRDEDERRREDLEERRKEREKYEADRIAAETRHREVETKLQASLEQQRLESERRDREAREDRARLERERLDADHRSQMNGLAGLIESLKKDIADVRTGNLAQQQQRGNGDWLALAGTIAPIVTNYLAAERESRTFERQQRTEEAIRDRDRAGRETDQMMRLVNMFGESQLTAARVNGELIQRMQDPSAMMGMTKLLTETMGSSVQMMAQLARSGFGSGGGSDHKVDIGAIIGQALETAGTVFGNYTAMKERELELMGQQQLPQAPPSFVPAGYPQQSVQPPVQPSHPVAARQPTSPATVAAEPTPASTEVDDSNKVLKGMVDTFRAGVARKIEPAKIAKMISAIIYGAESFGVEKSDPRLAQILNALKIDPFRALKMLFPSVDPAYLQAIADEVIAQFGTETRASTSKPSVATPRPAHAASPARPPVQPAQPMQPTAGPRPVSPIITPPPTPTPAPTPTTVTTTAPIADEEPPTSLSNGGVQSSRPSTPTPVEPLPVAMPGKRGRGRPRLAKPVETRPVVPDPVDPPAPPAS